MPTILVADDNTNIQKMVSLAFIERGIDVVAVGNGEAAVRRLADLRPDLVLADIFMPVRNGYEVCEYVKRDPRFSSIPVILLVGAFDPLDEKEAHRVGADGVLKKPFVPPDPLIAMVTSVLEKNPKVAAELAAAKQRASEPAATKTSVTPARTAPTARKAPAEFPEPSPEEAALVYGFGTGRRGLDPSQLPVEPQVPISDSDETEQFDGAATTRDWRRSAMNFEVPEEAAGKPAFAEDMNSPSAVMIETPPPQLQPQVKIEEPAQKVQAFVEQAPEIPEIKEAPKTSAAPEAHGSRWAGEPETRLDPIVFDKDPEPKIHETAAPAPEPSEKPWIRAVDAKVEPAISTKDIEPEVRETPFVQAQAAPEPASEPSLTTKAAGWIESIFPAKYPKGGWFSSLTHPASKAETPGTDAAAEEIPALAEEMPAHVPLESAEIHEFSTETKPQVEAEIAGGSAGIPSVEPDVVDDDSFFAEEPEATLAEAAALPGVIEDIPQTCPEPEVPEPVAIAQIEPASQPLPASTRTWLSDTDPNLVEPPAVRVTPEPLLVNDDPPGRSDYGWRTEELPPLHSFLVPAPEVPMPETEPVGAVQESNHAPVAAHAELPLEAGERIPTVPPPSREALSEIPFLSPPASIAQAPPDHANTVNAELVDAVVRKVLERIEPQLHELLSNGVLKPLVENILQGEPTKTTQ